MSKIVFISPNNEMANTAAEVLLEFDEKIEILIGLNENGVKIAKQLDNEDIDVIITRGVAALMMKEKGIRTPIIEIPIKEKDLVEAINKAKNLVKKTNPRIGYIGFEYMIKTIKMIVDILNINIKIYELANNDNIEKSVAQAINDGVDVIIGGVSAKECADKYNLPAVFLNTTKETFIEVFKIAKEVKYARMLEKKKTNEIKAIYDSVFEPLISFDENGIISLFNSAAELFFKIKSSDAINKNIKDVVTIIDDGMLQSILKDGQVILGKIVKINDTFIILNCTPIIVNNKIMSAILSFQEIAKIQNIETQIRKELYTKGNVAEYTFENIKGISKEINEAKRIAENFSKLDSIVLIVGETGTGKELFAQSIHNSSLRSQCPFVAINCGAISPNLLVSELFGYSDGSFTGAKKGGKEGLFEIAHKGTIFLDEISEMDVLGQINLLRVIQEKQIRRVGDNKIIPIDVRIVAATNKNLFQLVKENKFREDLYYRLNVLTLYIPPLRERLADIEFLLKDFLNEYSKKFLKYIELTDEAIEEIKKYPWLGNVRQLKSFCERLVAIAYQKIIDIDFLKNQLDNKIFFQKNENVLPTNETKYDSPYFKQNEFNKTIIELLHKNNGNKSKVAEILGISRTTLWRHIKQSNITHKFGINNYLNHY